LPASDCLISFSDSVAPAYRLQSVSIRQGGIYQLVSDRARIWPHSPRRPLPERNGHGR